jgi:ParB-like chromosome segregation protein Spo0J
VTAADPWDDQPVSHVRWVPVERVRANAYNPNQVAPNELRLLHASIAADGYTQPCVTIWDADAGMFEIVDGFHRYLVGKDRPDIRERVAGHLPLVVIDKPIAERMASTIRHNRARGRHSVTGMASIVFAMLDGGMTEAEVCAQLGMEADEMIRLKHVTGFAKLFEGVEYRRAWETRRQIRIRQDHERAAAQG